MRMAHIPSMTSYQYQEYHHFFAQVAPGLEELCAEEITSLGGQEVKSAYRGIHFKGSAKVLYGVNYNSRLATRILAPLITFDCHSTKYLYRTAAKLQWSDFLTPEQSFAILAQVSNSRIRHSQYAALKLKDAIVDHFMESGNKRPSVDTRSPDVRFNLHIENNRAVISLDTSGSSLHRRGYRKEGLEAPMQETLAAAIVKLSNWQGELPLLDPMCGSGTLLAEALMHLKGIPSAQLRSSFGFQWLPDFDVETWGDVRREGQEAIRDIAPGQIKGGDILPSAVEASRKNLEALSQSKLVEIHKRDFQDWQLDTPHVILCNPPYGLRMGAGIDMRDFYKGLGDYLKRNCQDSSAYIYFGNRENLKYIGLRPSWKKALMNGGLDGRLALYELY